MIIFIEIKYSMKILWTGDPGSDVLLLIIIIIICGASAPSHLVGKEYGATAPGYLH